MNTQKNSINEKNASSSNPGPNEYSRTIPAEILLKSDQKNGNFEKPDTELKSFLGIQNIQNE